jgi:hypothetical protein
MRRSKLLAGFVATGACAAVVAVAAPASAATAIGTADNFFRQCDASVYVSDDLIGSAGKVEAWAGFSCPQTYPFVGQIRLVLKDGTRTVKSVGKNVNASTDSLSITVPNAAGAQNWHADLLIFSPSLAQVIVSTGVVRS